MLDTHEVQFNTMMQIEEFASDPRLACLKPKLETEPELEPNHDSRCTRLYPDTVKIKHEDEPADTDEDTFLLLRDNDHLNDITIKDEIEALAIRDAIDDKTKTWDLDAISISGAKSNNRLRTRLECLPDKPEGKISALKLFSCDHCDHTFTTNRQLKVHTKTHAEKILFNCRICFYTTPYRANLKRHEVIHTGKKPFICKFCDYSTAYPNYLKTHEMLHTGEKPFKCKFCTYSAIQISHIKSHEMIHTSEMPSKHSRSNIQQTCKFCSYSSRHNSVLKSHEMRHIGEKPYACKYCSYKSSQRTHIRTHEKIHTREKPFACKLCGYTATRRFHLKLHELIHTRKKTAKRQENQVHHRVFECDYCHKQFQHKRHLVNHIKSHV